MMEIIAGRDLCQFADAGKMASGRLVPVRDPVPIERRIIFSTRTSVCAKFALCARFLSCQCKRNMSEL